MTVLFDVTPVERALDSILAYAYPPIDISPIIRLPSVASRTSRADQLATVLRDVSETRDAVARLETRLEQVIYGLQQRRAAAVAALAPVSGLPTEILREVFLLVAESDKTSKARIVLSHVSSSWRTVSLGFKELWTIIQVPHSCPDMVHEFARRSEDLRLELSTLSTSRWPDDLELNHSEVSRLAVVIHTSIPPAPLRASFRSAQDLISLDKCILVGVNNRQYDHYSAYSTKSLELSNSSLSWSPSRQMTHLASLTLANTSIEIINSLFSRLDAPSLCELRLRDVETGYASDSDIDSEEGLHEFDEVDLGEYDEQITTLIITECCMQVLEHLCLSLNVPFLTSLTIALDEHKALVGLRFFRLKDMLLTCPELEHLNLSLGIIPNKDMMRFWENTGNGLLVPKLRTFRLSSLRRAIAGNKDVAVHFLRAMVSRANTVGIERLRRLVVSRCFVRGEDEEQLCTCADELVLLDST